MADVLPTDRLTRKRNVNLQKQLQVTLQILSEEYRQTKERLYKDERECGQFLQSLHHTVPGLQSYGQPDTRAMNTNTMLRERRYSLSVHSALDYDSDDDDTPLKRLAAAWIYPDTNRPRSGHGGVREARDERAGQSGGVEGAGSGFKRPGLDMFRKNAGSGGQDSPSRGNSAVTPAVVKATARPSTAGPAPVSRRPMTSSMTHRGHEHKRRPATGFDARDRDVSSRYGRNAYSEYERETHDQVINKFQHIFDPNTRPKSATLTPKATPVVIGDPTVHGPQSVSTTTMSVAATDRGTTQNGRVADSKKGDSVNKKLPGSRRVVWSAHPARRRVGVVSAPNSASGPRDKSPVRASTPGGNPGNGGSDGGFVARSTTACVLSNGTEKGHGTPANAKHAHFTSAIKPMVPQAPTSHHHLNNHNHVDSSSSLSQNLLNVPGSQEHAHSTEAHHARHTHQSGPPPMSQHKHAAHPARPASRMSEASDVTTNLEFVNRLLHAGEKAGEKKRPKTAPSKYELSVRSIPAPRQTVVGILSQIENRKADMRTMLKTSKALQKAVNKLVPWDKLIEQTGALGQTD